MEDAVIQLIKLAQAGDESAFSELYRRFYHSVYKKAFQMSKNDADAKDIAQEAFYELHRSLIHLQDPQRFYGWLMLITSSKAKNSFRKRKPVLLGDDLQNMAVEDTHMDANPNVNVQDESDKQIIHRLIEDLPGKYKQVLTMFYLQDMKLIEIADDLQIPLGTIKTRVVRARNELQKRVCEFEKTEQRKLGFHTDAVLPVATMGTLSSIFFHTSNVCKQALHLVASNAVMSGCIVTMSALAISGGAFVYEDYQNSKNSEDVFLRTKQPLPVNAFPQAVYQEKEVVSSRDAYFVCLNFAPDEEAMKTRTKEEFAEIIPLYETLKQNNSTYYQMLKKQGWVDAFEIISKAI